MKQKCIICSKAKGKRGCLLKNMTLICPRCCAEIRSSECEGCSYYKDSQKFAIEKARKAPKHFVARIAPEIDDEIDRALMMVETGNVAAGERIISSLMEENADLYTIHFAMGTIHALKEEQDEAIVCFDKSLEIFPYFIECWFNRALSAQNNKDLIEMVASLRKVIEFGDYSDEVVIQAKQLLGDCEQITYETNGLELDVYIGSIKQFDATFELMQDGQWEQAIAGFKEVIKINSKATQAFGNMGLCYVYLNENKQAIEAYDMAIELDPHYEPAIINKEMLLRAMDKGLTYSETQADTKVIEYGKDYSDKDKLLIEDYLDGKLHK